MATQIKCILLLLLVVGFISPVFAVDCANTAGAMTEDCTQVANIVITGSLSTEGYIWDTDIYNLTVTGDVSVNGASGKLDAGDGDLMTFGSLVISATNTYNATSGTTLITSENSGANRIIGNAGIFIHNDGTVEATGAVVSRIDMGGDLLYNLIINAPGLTIQLNSAMTIANDLTITQGSFSPNNKGLTVNGITDVYGTFSGSGGTTSLNSLIVSSGGDFIPSSGTTTVTGDASITGTYDGTNNGINNFGSLTINSGGTYDATSGTTTILTPGADILNFGTFNHNNGLFVIGQASMNYNNDASAVEMVFYNLSITRDIFIKNDITVVNRLSGTQAFFTYFKTIYTIGNSTQSGVVDCSEGFQSVNALAFGSGLSDGWTIRANSSDYPAELSSTTMANAYWDKKPGTWYFENVIAGGTFNAHTGDSDAITVNTNNVSFDVFELYSTDTLTVSGGSFDIVDGTAYLDGTVNVYGVEAFSNDFNTNHSATTDKNLNFNLAQVQNMSLFTSDYYFTSDANITEILYLDMGVTAFANAGVTVYYCTTTGDGTMSGAGTFVSYCRLDAPILHYPVNDVVTNNSSIVFNWTAVESDNYLMYIYDSSQSQYYFNDTITEDNLTYVSEFADGNYTWEVYANDSTGVSFSSENSSFKIDANAPDITAYTITASLTSGETATIRANITDNLDVSTIDAVWFTLNCTYNGVLTNYTMEQEGSTEFYNTSFSACYVGTHYYQVFANDSEGNEASISEQSFVISKPSATTTETYPIAVTPSTYIRIISNFTNIDLVNGVYAYLYVPSGFVLSDTTTYPQNKSFGNLSADETALAEWRLFTPNANQTYNFNVTWSDDYANDWDANITMIVTYDTANLTDRVSILESQVSILQTQMSGVQTNVTVLQSDVTNLNTSINDLTINVSANAGNITEIQNNITNIYLDIISINSSVNSMNDTINQNIENITAIESNLTQMLSNITTLEQNVTTLVSRIDTINDSVQEILSSGISVNVAPNVEIDAGNDFNSEIYVRDLYGNYINATSITISLIDPLGDVSVGPTTAGVGNISTGIYNYTKATASSWTNGEWQILVSVVVNGKTYTDRDYFKITSGPFDVRNIEITDATSPSLIAEVVLENLGNAAKDIVLDWSLTRIDTGEVLDFGQDTVGVAGGSTATHSFTMTSTYVGDAQLQILGYYGVGFTERAGATESFSILAQEILESENDGSGSSTADKAATPATQVTGASTSEITVDFYLVEDDIETLNNVGISNAKSFTLDNYHAHSIIVRSIGQDEKGWFAIIEIASEPKQIKIYLDETKEVDVDDDGVNDIAIHLDKIENGKVDLVVSKLHEIVFAPPMETAELRSIKIPDINIKVPTISTSVLLLAGIVILVTFVAIKHTDKVTRFSKRVKSFHESFKPHKRKKQFDWKKATIQITILALIFCIFMNLYGFDTTASSGALGTILMDGFYRLLILIGFIVAMIIVLIKGTNLRGEIKFGSEPRKYESEILQPIIQKPIIIAPPGSQKIVKLNEKPKHVYHPKTKNHMVCPPMHKPAKKHIHEAKRVLELYGFKIKDRQKK